MSRNPNIEQLKNDIQMKKAQRVSRQQHVRETLSTLSMASVPSSGRNTSFVCDSLHFICKVDLFDDILGDE